MPPPRPLPPLPIDVVLPDMLRTLADSSNAVLAAPPGAGKTTRVPLALLGADWLGGRRILVLEPRRLAARGAAAHMASILGERLGETIGLRARLTTTVGPATRIEVITEGVFTRMILDDPALEDVGAVLFDEFHERSLDADLGLALALDAQSGLRPDLRLVVMSATLDCARVSALLDDAAVIASAGRTFPVETRYRPRNNRSARLDDDVAAAVAAALAGDDGSLLVFLPGQGEIRRLAERLGEQLRRSDVDIAPLYAGLDLAEQDEAIRPAPPGRRKIVLATSIAETSLTIEGIRIVIDCGQARVPRYEPGAGLTRLETVRVSRAAADQRRGRAGRLEPGVCYRLWAEPETASLPPFAEPEIRQADLGRLIIDCAAWGVTAPQTLRWLDPPPAAALDAARADLTALDAIDGQGRLSPLGRALSRLPLPPRIAAMLVGAAETGQEALAAKIAAVLVERGIGGTDTDLEVRLTRFAAERSRRAEDMRRLAGQWAKAAKREAADIERKSAGADGPGTPAALLALAYPDRIAKARDHGGTYLMASGRAAVLGDDDALLRAPFLVVGEITGTAAAGRIRLACRLDERELETIAAHRIEVSTSTRLDPATLSIRTTTTRRLGAITLATSTRPAAASAETQSLLAAGIAAAGIERLPWSKAQLHTRCRVGFLAANESGDWPDLSDAGLAATAETWLAPFLAGKTALQQISADDLGHAIALLLPHDLRQRLDREAPSHYVAPTGQHHPIDYGAEQGPTVSIRVQELFGVSIHPAIASRRIPLVFQLLSPAHRPIQVTRDIPGFWAGSWRDVRAEMRGRYPKHAWPEDPKAAPPTTRAKPRGT